MPPNMHDSGYKLLFSNRTIFRQLIETFVDAPWVKEVDFTRCEPVDKSFVSDEYRQRESDLIYRCLLYTSPSPRDRTRSRMPSSA